MIFPRSRPLAKIEPRILTESEPNPNPIGQDQTRIERIKHRGLIRIGFDPDKMPFAYFNAAGQLIGFDIEMANYLADDLQVDIEFVPFNRAELRQQLRDDHFDVAMSALEGTVKQAAMLPSIDPYMDVTLAVVVPDHEKRRFRSRDTIKNIPDLKLAVIKGSYFAERAAKVFQDKQDIQIVELDSAADYFDGKHTDVNGLVISAESGSAWTLRHPRYTVANPLQGQIRVPLYYLTATDTEFEQFLQNWLTLKRSDGTQQQLYDYWILGQDKQTQTPRWSILRDVLGWVD